MLPRANKLVCVFLVSLAATSVADAQFVRGSILGRVTDQTDAIVSDAQVKLQNQGTNEGKTASTDAEGNYSFPALLPGAYRIEVSRQGFTTQVVSDIGLEVNQTARIDVKLAVGELVQRVETTASLQLLKTDASDVGAVISNKQIIELPLNGRDYLSLARLIPGAIPSRAGATAGQKGVNRSVNVAGARGHFGRFSYNLPLGKGRRFLNNGTAVDKVVGGWQVNGITSFQSGPPFTLATPGDNANIGASNQRPNLAGDPYGGIDRSAAIQKHGVDQGTTYFNKAAFVLPPLFRLGNVGKNTLYGPGSQNWDFSVFKNTGITERINAQLRAEFFNVFNHPNFNLPIRVLKDVDELTAWLRKTLPADITIDGADASALRYLHRRTCSVSAGNGEGVPPLR